MPFESLFSLWNPSGPDSAAVLALEVFIKACLILSLTAIVAQARSRLSAATRHRLWCCAFAGLVVIPVMAIGLPGWQLPMLPSSPKASADLRDNQARPTSPVAGIPNVSVTARQIEFENVSDDSYRNAFAASKSARTTPIGNNMEHTESGAPLEEDSQASLADTLQKDWTSTWFSVWLFGVVVALLPLPISTLRAARLLRASQRIQDEGMLGLLDEIKCRFGLKRDIQLFEIEQRVMPMTWGFTRSIVLLPATWANWSTRRKRIVLAHELAHVARRDLRWQVLARIACAVHWFNPLTWYAFRRLRAEQEFACDDCVVHVGTRASDYATELVGIAESHQARSGTLAVAMASSGDLENRLKSLFDGARSHLPLRQKWAIALLFVGVVASAVASLLHPVAVTAEDVADAKSKEANVTDGKTAADSSSDEMEFAGTVVDMDGKPVAGAEIWCAAPPLDYEDAAAPGNVRRLALSDRQGKFSFRLKPLVGAGLDSANWTYRSQLTAKAAGHGLDWLPLAVFERKPASSPNRARLQRNVDKLFGIGRFASQTLKLPRDAGPVRGRLLDLEGRPLAGVVVRVERIQDPDIAALLEALETSSSDLYYQSINNRSALGVWITRNEWRALMPSVKTNENGEFTLRGLGVDQMATVTLFADRVAAEQFYILGREMETKRLPHIFSYPNGPKDVYVGTRFTHSVGPAFPVSGVVTEFQSGKPIANATVYVERLFRREGRDSVVQLRLNTRHIRAVTDQQGRYQLVGIPPGQGHVLNVTAPKSEPWLMAMKEFSVDSKEKSAAVDVKVFRGIWIDGRVTDAATGEPVKGRVDYLALRKNPNIPQRFGLEDGWEIGRFPIDETGHYRVVGLPGPGVVLVHSSGKKTYPLSVGAEKVDGYEDKNYLPTTPIGLPLTNWHRIQQIDPPADARSHTLDLTLTAGASLVGRIVRPEGAPATVVEVQGQVAKNPFFRELMDDTFTVHDYEPGVPRNLFFRSVDNSWVAHLHLEDAPPADLSVTLQPAVTVRGRLIETETGEAAVGYHVHCKSSKYGRLRLDDVRATNEEGRFEVKGLMAGYIYQMDSSNVQRFVSGKNQFTVDLTHAKPGDVLELGDVTGKNAKSSK